MDTADRIRARLFLVYPETLNTYCTASVWPAEERSAGNGEENNYRHEIKH